MLTYVLLILATEKRDNGVDWRNKKVSSGQLGIKEGE